MKYKHLLHRKLSTVFRIILYLIIYSTFRVSFLRLMTFVLVYKMNVDLFQIINNGSFIYASL